MILPNNATVAVADGGSLRLFRNGGHEAELRLEALPDPTFTVGDGGSGGRHHSGSDNPDASRLNEDSFAAAAAAWLNKAVLEGRIGSLVVIAAPKTLGELRRHYHKQLQAVLAGELSKDLAGRPASEVETAIANH